MNSRKRKRRGCSSSDSFATETTENAEIIQLKSLFSLSSLCFLWLFKLAVALPADPPMEINQLSDAIVARVNGKPILLSQMKQAAMDLEVPLSSLSVEGLRGEGFRKAITTLVDEELLVQAAQAQSLTSDDVEISRRVDAMIRRLTDKMGGAEPLARFLKSSNLTLESVRKMMVEREKRQDLIGGFIARHVQVTGDEIAEFRKRRGEAKEPIEEGLFGQIFFHCPKAEQLLPIGKAQLDKALLAAKDAGKEPSKFPQIARERTEDVEGRERGGMLGWLDPATLQEPLRKRVKTLNVNQVTEPIATDQGYHVLYLADWHSSRDLLFAEKFEQARVKLLESLRSSASIEIYPLKD